MKKLIKIIQKLDTLDLFIKNGWEHDFIISNLNERGADDLISSETYSKEYPKRRKYFFTLNRLIPKDERRGDYKLPDLDDDPRIDASLGWRLYGKETIRKKVITSDRMDFVGVTPYKDALFKLIDIMIQLEQKSIVKK